MIDFSNLIDDAESLPIDKSSSTAIDATSVTVGHKVYFEDETGGHYGKVHYIPSDEEQAFFQRVHNEKCLSIMPNGKNKRAKFVPISMIILKGK